MQETDIKQVAAKISQLKRNGKSTVLFLGAGASKSAGIPLADEIVAEIESNEEFKDFFEDLTKKTYPIYMNRLSSNDRKKLFNKYIKEAKINPAHFYAGQLVKEGYVDCIITTNFDPLMLKCLTLFYGIIPYVYDLAIANSTVTNDFEYPAIIHLHGQAHGFWQLNTEDELDLPEQLISDMFSKISMNRTIIIVGYSGNDPVLKHLAKVGNFCENLYWIGYEDNEPSNNVKENLLNKRANGSYFVRNYNADSFFLTLKNQLKLNEPLIYSKPFTFLLKNLEIIQPIQKDDRTLDMFDVTKGQIQKAIEGFEKKKGFANNKEVEKKKISRDDLLKKIKEIYNSDKFIELNTIQEELEQTNDEEIIKYYAYTYNSWGVKLYNLAKGDEGNDKKVLINQCIEKYKKAIEIKNDFYEAFNNWGNALSRQASREKDEKVDNLFKESFEKFREAIEIRNDYYLAYYNWGIALSFLALMKEAEEAERLLNESNKKYEQAIKIKNDYYMAYYYWGIGLSELARKKNGEEAERLLNDSFGKYRKTIEIKNDHYQTYYRWGNGLGYLASMKEGNEAQILFNESFEKYKQAIAIKEDYMEAYNNWTIGLLTLANKVAKDEAIILLLTAIEKSKKVEELKKGKGAYNLACAYSLLNDVEKAIYWFNEAMQFGEVARGHIEVDSDLDNIRNDPRFKELLEKYRPITT